MLYFIDGHNLVPHIRGLNLSDLDDEMQLIERLLLFTKGKRNTIEVYFDQAAAGHSGSRKFGSLTAHFVSSATIADEAIINRIRKMGAAAKNCTVVTSDRRIIAECTALKVKVIPSAEFAALMQKSAVKLAKETKEKAELSDAEIEEWMKYFSGSEKF